MVLKNRHYLMLLRLGILAGKAEASKGKASPWVKKKAKGQSASKLEHSLEKTSYGSKNGDISQPHQASCICLRHSLLHTMFL